MLDDVDVDGFVDRNENLLTSEQRQSQSDPTALCFRLVASVLAEPSHLGPPFISSSSALSAAAVPLRTQSFARASWAIGVVLILQVCC